MDILSIIKENATNNIIELNKRIDTYNQILTDLIPSKVSYSLEIVKAEYAEDPMDREYSEDFVRLYNAKLPSDNKIFLEDKQVFSSDDIKKTTEYLIENNYIILNAENDYIFYTHIDTMRIYMDTPEKFYTDEELIKLANNELNNYKIMYNHYLNDNVYSIELSLQVSVNASEIITNILPEVYYGYTSATHARESLDQQIKEQLER